MTRTDTTANRSGQSTPPVRVVRFHFIQSTGSFRTQKELQENRKFYDMVDESNKRILGL